MSPTHAVPVSALLLLVVAGSRLESQTPKDPTRVIWIENVRTLEPNSAGGVEVRFAWRNLSPTKIVKYAWFDVIPYNAVNDRVASEIGRKVLATLESVGPVAPGHWDGEVDDPGPPRESILWVPKDTTGNTTGAAAYMFDEGWGDVWYNSEIVRVEIRRVRIQYIDGSRVTIERSGVKKTLHCHEWSELQGAFCGEADK